MVKVMGDPWDAEEHPPAPSPPGEGVQAVPPTTSTHPGSTRAASSQITEDDDCQTLPGRHNRLRRAVGMEGLGTGSVLLTGCDGGLGLGLLKGLLEQPSPPRHLFAACLDPQGKVGRVLGQGQGGSAPGRAGKRSAWGCHHPHPALRGLRVSIPHHEWHGKIHIFIYI